MTEGIKELEVLKMATEVARLMKKLEACCSDLVLKSMGFRARNSWDLNPITYQMDDSDR